MDDFFLALVLAPGHPQRLKPKYAGLVLTIAVLQEPLGQELRQLNVGLSA